MNFGSGMDNKRNEIEPRNSEFLHLRSIDRSRGEKNEELADGNPIPQESIFEPIINIKIEEERIVLPTGGSSGEIEISQFVLDSDSESPTDCEYLAEYSGTMGKSAEEVDSILELINWLDSCGTININEEDEELIRNQICRFYSEFFKGPRSATTTHDLQRRKSRSTTSTASPSISKRTRNITDKKNVKDDSKSKEDEDEDVNVSSEENSQGLSPDWISLIPTIEEEAEKTTERHEFRNEAGDCEESLSLSPPHSDNPISTPAKKKKADRQKRSRNHACDECGKIFRLKRYLTKHLEIHTGNSHVCEVCGKGFTRKEYLSKHLEIHAENSHVCEICWKGFTRKIYLSKHLETHANLKSHVCEICGKRFNQQHCLQSHRKVHDEPKFVCDQCPKSFFFRSHLNVHQLIHFGDKKHVCHVCNKGFLRLPELTSHLLVHSEEKSFKCTFCPKEFRHRKTLTSHVRIHTGDKRYKCEPCGEAFVQIGSLISHNRTHHGIVKEKVKNRN